MMFGTARSPPRRKNRFSAHDAPATFRVSRAAHAGGSRAHPRWRGRERHAARGRHGLAAEYETPATGSANADEFAPHREFARVAAWRLGLAARRFRLPNWRLRDAL